MKKPSWEFSRKLWHKFKIISQGKKQLCSNYAILYVDKKYCKSILWLAHKLTDFMFVVGDAVCELMPSARLSSLLYAAVTLAQEPEVACLKNWQVFTCDRYPCTMEISQGICKQNNGLFYSKYFSNMSLNEESNEYFKINLLEFFSIFGVLHLRPRHFSSHFFYKILVVASKALWPAVTEHPLSEF